MQGDSKVIDYLNRVLANELTAINQYFTHGKMCQNWGLERLGAATRQESIEEMRHAEALVDRVLFLEGLPNLQDLGKLRIGETVEEQLRSDLDLELEALPLLREGVAYCRDHTDEGSKELLQGILTDEERHVDFLETQLDLIQKVGIDNYLQSQMGASE